MSKLRLEQDAVHVVCSLVETQLTAAKTAFGALQAGADPEALHDLRVALRRTRSLLRAYRDVFPLRKRLRRALSALAAATNPARDAEVLHVLYVGLLPTLVCPAEAQAGVNWLGLRLDAEVAETAQAARAALERELEHLCRHLHHALQAQADTDGPPWRAVLGPMLETSWQQLEADLQTLHGHFDMAGAHQARIAAKRLRYLLEPLRDVASAEVAAAAAAMVSTTRSLQTLLGDLHDVQVFADWLVRSAEAVGARQAGIQLRLALGHVQDSSPPSVQDEVAPALLPGLLCLAQSVRTAEAAQSARAQAWLAEGGTVGLAQGVQALLKAL